MSLALFRPGVVLWLALVLAPFLLPGLFEELFLTARDRCEVGVWAWWGGVALWGTLLCLSVAGGSWLDRRGSGIAALRGLGESCAFSHLSFPYLTLFQAAELKVAAAGTEEKRFQPVSHV